MLHCCTNLALMDGDRNYFDIVKGFVPLVRPDIFDLMDDFKARSGDSKDAID